MATYLQTLRSTDVSRRFIVTQNMYFTFFEPQLSADEKEIQFQTKFPLDAMDRLTGRQYIFQYSGRETSQEADNLRLRVFLEGDWMTYRRDASLEVGTVVEFSWSLNPRLLLVAVVQQPPPRQDPKPVAVAAPDNAPIRKRKGIMKDFAFECGYGQRRSRRLAGAAASNRQVDGDCTPDILTSFMDGMSKLLVRLQNGKRLVQEGAPSMLTSIADCSQDRFQKYYNTLMPILKAVLIYAMCKSNHVLRGKAMNCISLVGLDVGKEKFRDDAEQVMEVFMSLQESQAWTRLFQCLGQDTLQFISDAMPLLPSVHLKPDVTMSLADSNNDIADSDERSMGTVTYGDKKVLDEKATVCNMLCCYADKLKDGDYRWIDQVATTLVPLKFYFHEEVRRAAVSAKLAVEKGVAKGCDGSYVKQLSNDIIPVLVALLKDPDIEAWTRLCQCLGQEFLPFINVVMPLPQSTQLKSDVTITSANRDTDERSMRRITCGEKATACNMLCCYTDESKDGFYLRTDQEHFLKYCDVAEPVAMTAETVRNDAVISCVMPEGAENPKAEHLDA